MYRYFLKPLFDFLLSLLGLIILSPIFLILIIAIKIDSRGPILFKQKRVGKNKKLFKICKFRTMRIDTPKDTPTHLLQNPEQYITKVGRFLRKTSLDELPQILNILFFKMSIVGPRPALWNQEDLIAERDKYGANNIRPGLTGWAQVNGRDEIEIPVKAKFDGYYVKKLGPIIDIKVFFKTIAKVFKSDGVLEGGTGTLEKNAHNIDYDLLPKTSTDYREFQPFTIEGTEGESSLEAETESTESNEGTDNILVLDRIIEDAASVQEQILILNSKENEEKTDTKKEVVDEESADNRSE